MAAQHSQREAQRGSFELRDPEAHPGARVQGHIVRAVEPGFEPVWLKALLRPLCSSVSVTSSGLDQPEAVDRGLLRGGVRGLCSKGGSLLFTLYTSAFSLFCFGICVSFICTFFYLFLIVQVMPEYALCV